MKQENPQIEKDPLKSMLKPKVEKRLIEDLPDEVLALVLDQMGNTTFNEIRDRAIIYMFIDTGMRLGGVTSLKVDQFNLDTGWGKVIEKGNKERGIKLTTQLTEQLKKYVAIREPLAKSKALWINREGTGIDKGTIGSMVRNLNDLPGVKESIALLAPNNRIHPHIFRHVWAKHMAQSDIPIQAIQVMGGWDTIELVMYYAKAYSSESAWKQIEHASPLNAITGKKSAD